MKAIGFRHLTAICLFSQIIAPDAGAAQPNAILHHLKFAVSSGIPFTNQDADDILAQMNKIMAGANSAWPWDVKCSGAQFVRDGDVIVSHDISQSGDFDNLKANLRKVEPTANVYVVLNLDCSGSPAGGCSDVGSEPAVVTAQWGLATDAVIFLHERGHNMGLQHSSDPPNGSDLHRIMYWEPDTDHIGKTLEECQHYLALQFASTTSAGSNTAIASQQQPGQSAAPAAAAALPATALADQAKALGLTVPAYSAISRPWLDQNSAEKVIAALNDQDVASIRDYLQRNAHGSGSLISQAMQVIGHRGTTNDVALLRQVLESPAAAALPGPQTFDERETVRRSLAQKNIAAQSLGDLAKRTNSAEAVDVLKDHVDLNQAAAVAGKDAAIGLSRSALKALSTTTEGAPFVQQVLDKTKPNTPDSTEMHKSIDVGDNKVISAPPLTPTLRAQLQENVNSAANSP